MRRLTIVVLLLAISFGSYSQQITAPGSNVQTDYRQKSKHQKTTGWVLLGGGTLLATIGILSNAHEVYDPNSFDRKYSTKGTPLIIAGLAAIGASIPLFIMSSHNKHKAASLALRTEALPHSHETSMVYHRILKISL
jgi:hypothetical protein